MSVICSYSNKRDPWKKCTEELLAPVDEADGEDDTELKTILGVYALSNEPVTSLAPFKR